MVRLSVILMGLALVSACRGHRNDPIGPGWERLGTRMVNHRGDHDVILAGGQGTFRAIRVDVDRTELEMWDIIIHYGNGDTHRPAIRHYFREGSWSRTIDLPGGQRTVKSVEFWYRTAHRGEGRANVDVWGLH